MKKNLLALSVALAVGSMSCAYAAVPQTASVGVLGGFSFLEAGSNEYAKISDKSGYAVGAYFGYDFTSWIGVETAYQYLGGFEATDKAAKKDHFQRLVLMSSLKLVVCTLRPTITAITATTGDQLSVLAFSTYLTMV